jgi:para-nitrobenzyl esterase
MGNTITRITQGELRGSEHDGIVRFAGIPYAASISGAARFRPPAPPEPWSGVRDATAYGPIAPQHDFMAVFLGGEPEPQDEDCLYLNVFTPGVDDARRPVMVWIHGGAFILGSGSSPGYDGSALARRGDVVVVTINYRLGALGFLHLGYLDDDYHGSGNAAILDQVAALEWVRDNITAFGGDPGNVTIFGESAGGMSVGTLLGTPAARGLFHKAIPQSGAAHNATPAVHAAEVAQQYLDAAGAATVEDLLELPTEQVLTAQAQFSMGTFTDLESQLSSASDFRIPFQPVVDGVVLEHRAIDAIAAGAAAGIPVLIGTCRDEWNLFKFMDPTPIDDDVLLRRFEKVFPDGAAAVDVYRSALPGQVPADLFGAAVTDLVFRQPAIRLAEALTANGSPVYSYLFTWASPAMGGMLGSCHALDVPFVFGNLDTAGLGMLLGDAPPHDLAETVMDSWLAFARTGNPSNDRVGEWPTYDEENRPTMELGDQVQVLGDPEPERRQLWHALL